MNPAYFEKPTFNLANFTQDFEYDKYFLEKTIFFDKNIKKIILPISYFSFFLDLDTSIEGWRKYFYAHSCDYPIDKILDINNFSSIIPYSSKPRLFKSIFSYYFKCDLKSSWSDSGWGDFSDGRSLDLDSIGSNAAKIHSGNGLMYFGRNLQLFKDILEICNKNYKSFFVYAARSYFLPNTFG